MIDIDEKESALVIERFKELKTERNKYVPRWREIQEYVSITNEIHSEFEDTKQPAEQKDIYINDPTAFTCVYQAGDYLAGILWNLNAVTLKPSSYIKKQSGGADLSKFYKHATEVFLGQMNATDAGFSSVLKSYCYDQFSFATSGIGTFKSKEFVNSQSEYCLCFKPFGVWNSCIDEGANNKITVVFTVYNWRINQIIEEFCIDEEGNIDEQKLKNMPEEIQKEYQANKFNRKFKLVFGVLPNNHYRLNKRGKVGAKYKGYWFLDDSDNKVFHVEYFNKMPIAMCRAIRVNNQVYGESSGTLAISSIKMLNHITGQSVDNIEKVTDPALGVLSGALVAGNVFNRSAGAITEFNIQSIANGQSPVFPIAPSGDISAVVNFLIPEIRKNLVNIFKIDQLLDFNNQTQMTATESSYRMSIRGKSINGLLSQQKQECIEPTCHRAISIIQDCGLFGEILEDLPETTPEEIFYKEQVKKDGNVIPDVVAQAMKDNKIWYTLEFNGALEKLCNAEIYEAIGRFLQYLQAILQIQPELIHAINAYEFLELLKDVSNLVNDNLIKSKYAYEELLAKMQEEQARQAQMAEQAQQAQTMKDMATANKEGAIANATQF